MTFLTASVPSMVGWDEAAQAQSAYEVQQLDSWMCSVSSTMGFWKQQVEKSRMWSQHCGARNELSARPIAAGQKELSVGLMGPERPTKSL
jgi:hypothetical protein